MSGNVDKFESNVDYTTKLENFEGPLDLLLFLIKQAEIDIRDVFVSSVTDQFLGYVYNNKIPMETESEYLSIAATIIEIKSKAIIPNEEIQQEGEEQKEDFFQRLEEYKLYKEQSLKLKKQENLDRFYKEPDKGANDFKVVYSDFFNFQGLIDAFIGVLRRNDAQEFKMQEKEIPKEVFTVADKIRVIRTVVAERGSVSFYELVNVSSPRSEIITTFQAMLELIKLQIINFIQSDVFGDITIVKGAKEDAEVGELEEYN